MNGSRLAVALSAMLDSGDPELRGMAEERILDAIQATGTQAGAARLLGTSLRAVQRWVRQIRQNDAGGASDR